MMNTKPAEQTGEGKAPRELQFDSAGARIVDDWTIGHLEAWINSQFPMNRDDTLANMLSYLSSLDANARDYVLRNWSWWNVYDRSLGIYDI